ncbi:methyl-accepting chemotaxis sensory transducer [Candidatus Magnetoovum chiemensis]|nr:methyl-accepting chemotaxis sensory transducer [Candidatus Magnetoovum chiemensis]
MRNSIKFKLLYKIAVLLSVVFTALILKSYGDSQKLIKENGISVVETFYKVFESELASKVHDLSMSMELLLQNESIVSAFANKDRAELERLTSKYYNDSLKPVYGLDQFQFHVSPAKSFFRAHQPNKFDDDLSAFRQTVVDANKKKQKVTGIEVGRAGLGLRIVYPVSYEGNHIGTVEFGGGIESILTAAKEAANVYYAVGVYGDVFEKAKRFENSDTDIIKGRLVLFDYSAPEVRSIALDINDNKEINKIGSSTYLSKHFDLKDFSGNVIGELLAIKDISSDIANKKKGLIIEIVIGIGTVISMAVILFSLLMKTVLTPLQKAVIYTNKIGEGDLTVNIKAQSKDEMGSLYLSLQSMVERLTAIINKVMGVSDSVASSSKQLSQSSIRMSDGVEEQAQRSSQIAQSSSQMSKAIAEIANNALDIAESASNTLKLVKNGEAVVFKTGKEVKSIEVTVLESSKIIESLGLRSKQIGEIVNSINEIADQTNLLALNAAIESARAGEQGRGFAVVADEVRKLAEKTGKSTQEIREMIKTIQSETNTAIEAMNDSLKKVEQGVRLTNEAGSSLSNIVGKVNELLDKGKQIAAATENISASSTQIGQDIDVVANVSSNNTVNAAQLNNSSQELETLAQELRNLVYEFRL